MFEKASRLKLRFPYRGQCTIEDLWDIPIEALDDMFKTLNRLNQDEETLLINKDDDKEDILVLKIKIGIIRHVVSVRLKEQGEVQNEKGRADRKQALLHILAEKQNDELRSMPADELAKLIDEL